MRGSHRRGIISSGHFVEASFVEDEFAAEDIVDLTCDEGEAILLNNLTLHRSGVNSTSVRCPSSPPSSTNSGVPECVDRIPPSRDQSWTEFTVTDAATQAGN